tara:strand:+ start:51 stop:764 length:714 start_codon:yes stop_codon:yes gene_type:complete
MNFVVRQIKPELCSQWFLYKHYAKRKPNVSYAFGIYDNNGILVGVCSYSRPMSHTLVRGAFNGEYQKNFLELNRLVVNEGLPRNTLSFFVSRTLKLLPLPCVVVSYADTSQNHHGYIYQATNWVYTGLSAKRPDYKIRGLEHLHSATVADSAGRNDRAGVKIRDKSVKKIEILRHMYGDDLYVEERPRKHRYFYFVGNRTEKKDMRRKLCYKEHPYPKGNNVRYDASFSPEIQLELI